MARFVRGALAVLSLVAILVGIPVALVVFVGPPWTHPLPAAGTAWSDSSAGRIGDDAVITLLALVIWLAWTRVALSILLECVGRIGGARVPRVRVLGSAQNWAAALVSMAMLLVGTATRGVAAGGTMIARPLPVLLLDTQTRAPIVEVDASIEGGDARAATALEQATTSHVVERGESLWSIAEDVLGDGARWREILQINNGREVADGVVLDASARRLMPGWRVLVPSGLDAHVASSTTVRVEPGDTLSGLADRELGDARAWPEIWEANRGHRFGTRVFDDPNLIVTGWELIVPETRAAQASATVHPSATLPSPATRPSTADAAVPAPVVSTAAAPALAPSSSVSEAVADAGPVADTGPVANRQMAATDVPSPDPMVTQPISVADVMDSLDSSGEDLLAASGLGAAVLVASGTVGAVTVRRRRRLRAASVHARLSDPTPLIVRTERAMRKLADAEQIARLDIALRAAAAELVDAHHGVCVIGAVIGRDGRIELLLSADGLPAPPPWTPVNGRWRLEASTGLEVLADAARRSDQPCPAIAHIGSIASPVGDRDELFIDLEAIGLLVVDAPPDEAADVLRAIGVGLAVSPLAETTHLVTSGIDGWQFDHPSSHVAESIDVALDIAAGLIGATATATHRSLSTFALRARQSNGEPWEPAILIAADSERDAMVDADLVSIGASGGRGLAMVVGRAIEGAQWRIERRDDRWSFQPLGIDLVPVGLTPGDLAQVRAVLDEADRPLIVLDEPSEGEDNVSSSWTEPKWSLVVRVLGGVDVIDRNGRPVDFERSKALELVVWLSEHRDRSTRSGARTALWDADVRDATFANVVSDARRALARLVPPPPGEEWIGRTLTDKLPLHASVITDADLLRDRLAHAKGLDPRAAVEMLRPGLELVRDLPFAGTSYLWPDAEGITSNLTLLATSAATVLATHYLALADIDGVFWATAQGLKVLAGHEELIALRMRAHARQGDLGGVRNVWEEYERALNSDAWSSGEPAPKLVELRRQLLTPSLVEV